ncbi:hypothetical protein Tco_1470669 [Tanacetum coccineum]
MDDPNITIEEYIQLMADKAQGYFETDFLAIVYNDALASNQNVSSEPTEPSERNDNVGGVFINPDISKCWSCEISRRLFNTFLLKNSTWRIILSKLAEEFSRSISICHII